MKIAIHHRSGSFSDRWIEYCKQKGIDFKIVNVYDSDIVKQLKDCDAFMWHHSHGDYRDMLFAKQLIFSLETAGVRCFPNYHTTWHFDDKVGQKYLLESINAPFVPSYVFYTKREALRWIDDTTFPKVFKLRGGAGASNVQLVPKANEAKRIVKKAFGRGFPQFDRKGYLKERYHKWCEDNDSFVGVLKGVGRLFVVTDFAKMHAREKGYVYFQDFIPDNNTDYRVKVVNGNCWAFQRKVRKNDFRASGSGNLIFDNSQIPKELVSCAQEIAQRLKLQSVAFDFLHDKINNKFLIVELSYGFGFDEREIQNGFWDIKGQFHSELFNPFGWMVDGLLYEN
ncbi:MAG: hypothetical protein IKO56_06115 [Alphaproteobacteria bacterium]|nr:hypothetical protein [Alphaproteobacteria bacterium]